MEQKYKYLISLTSWNEYGFKTLFPFKLFDSLNHSINYLYKLINSLKGQLYIGQPFISSFNKIKLIEANEQYQLELYQVFNKANKPPKYKLICTEALTLIK